VATLEKEPDEAEETAFVDGLYESVTTRLRRCASCRSISTCTGCHLVADGWTLIAHATCEIVDVGTTKSSSHSLHHRRRHSDEYDYDDRDICIRVRVRDPQAAPVCAATRQALPRSGTLQQYQPVALGAIIGPLRSIDAQHSMVFSTLAHQPVAHLRTLARPLRVLDLGTLERAL
jgi:hypothetical protein